MGIRKALAQAASAVSSAALRHVFRRPAGNFPGKIALYIDPSIIADVRSRLSRGSVCVVGTNGKTTVTNMLADCLEASGQRVVCNRGGANLDSGVATSLLQATSGDWGVFECDELWLAKILPGLQAHYVLLLNLFYDQIDRVGEVAHIQESIAGALAQSPKTVLVYNADDPHCEKIARMVDNECGPFGMGEGLAGASGGNALMCQVCDHMLAYEYRSYGQLGAYRCPACDFGRSHLKFMARNCRIGAEGMSFDVVAATDERAVAGGAVAHIEAPYSGAYMAYNLLSVYAAGHLMGLSNDAMHEVMGSYDPKNGRLEHLFVHGHDVLLNLAKNPAGFNQNVALILQERGPVAAAFFVNDMEGDGRDVSWIWDVDFEALAGRSDTTVFVGGMRKADLLVRLRYAGVPAVCVDDAVEVMHRVAALGENCKVFMIANYTSLPGVRESCVKMAEDKAAPVPTEAQRLAPEALPNPPLEGEPLRIVHVLPDLLNQGGDAGNVSILAKRCIWRGIPVEVERVLCGDALDVSGADLVVVGDGFDREQRLACAQLMEHKEDLASYVERGGVMLAVDGGLQILGSTWYVGDEEMAGLGLLDLCNGRTQGDERLVGDIVVQTDVIDAPVVGFENHAGITMLGEDTEAFGSVLRGVGNNEGDGTEGVRYHNLLGTYVHGPVLAKCPALADWLIARALEQRSGTVVQLEPLDDSAEEAACAFMLDRLGLN
ncbi:MAG: DUF1727 domain-containing protein [Eggerthellaceae bacterium]|nr:DUF1727 domain-containing protein [Eggerthellaceae bacterium]